MPGDLVGAAELPDTLLSDQRSIERGGRLHLVHWGVLALSLVVTVGAWQYASRQVETQTEQRFLAYASQAVELITERMEKYEDALWSGVSAIYAKGGDITYPDWKVFANSLRIDTKYPGINGIGVIHAVPPDYLAAYLKQQREYRPDYRIHPPHNRNEYFPISYIEPVANNQSAVGLDMAHETNRYTAVIKARNSGAAQITGPIVLVQDQEQTPGFLFYAPFYKNGLPTSRAAREAGFTGVVYAPFIMKNLMAGTLQKEKRQVSIRISDGKDILYDEQIASEPDFDPDPLFRKMVSVDLYGRPWVFDISSAKSFRAAFGKNQPRYILAGGLLIDGLLLVLFVSLSRANRRAARFATRMSRDYQVKAEEMEQMVGKLARSNDELERFAYVASHDLQEPLRMVRNFTGLLKDDYREKLDDNARKYIDIAADSAERMQELVTDLLEYSRVSAEAENFEPVNLNTTFDYVIDNLRDSIEETGAEVSAGPLPTVRASGQRTARVLQNLIGNGLKYQAEAATAKIHVTAERQDGRWVVCVEDNGIGVPARYLDEIFQPFRRLHGISAYPGSGMGLPICRKIVEYAGGEIWAESREGQGSRFLFSIPVESETPASANTAYANMASANTASANTASANTASANTASANTASANTEGAEQ